MKRLVIAVSIISLFLIFMGSCYYDNEEALYPSIDNSCDTTNITYSITIVSLLSNNCYSCHSNVNAAPYGNNIRLENYSDVVTNASQALTAMKHQGSITPMPKNGAKLKDCLITQFDLWIKNGLIQN